MKGKQYSFYGGGRLPGKNAHVFIIAEAGVNHNGNLKLAKKLVDAAKSADADAVKFQTYVAEDLVTQKAPKAAYQKKTDRHQSQLRMLQKLQLSQKEFEALAAYCRKKKIIFLSTPFDLKSVETVNQLEVPFFKISSGEMTNTPLLSVVASMGKPVIVSTGMATLEEVRETVRFLRRKKCEDIVLLHCTTDYPTRFKDVNLKAMLTLKKAFRVPVGYSDHTMGIEVPIAAAALGASVIEKHMTLDRNLSGPDHKASLEPDEFQQMVKAVRNIEQSLGDGKKMPCGIEKKNKAIVRKSIVALQDIPKDSRITVEMLILKRPGNGIEPKYLKEIVGCTALKRIQADRLIQWKDVRN